MSETDEKSSVSGAFKVLKAIGTKLADALKPRPELAAIVLIVVVAAVVFLVAEAKVPSPEHLVLAFLLLALIGMVLCFTLGQKSSGTPSKEQRAVIAALENSQFEWLTASEVAEETQLPLAKVKKILSDLSVDTVIRSGDPSPSGAPKYTTKNAYSLRRSMGDRLRTALSDEIR